MDLWRMAKRIFLGYVFLNLLYLAWQAFQTNWPIAVFLAYPLLLIINSHVWKSTNSPSPYFYDEAEQEEQTEQEKNAHFYDYDDARVAQEQEDMETLLYIHNTPDRD